FVARIKATASALPGTISTALSVTTNGADSSGTPTGGGTTAPAGAPVIVDGKTENIGTEKKSGDTTTVTVDQSKLGTNIGGATTSSSVVVPVSENGSATASLVVKNIEDMAAKTMTLTVQSGGVAYNLNTSAIDTAALTAAFPGADMSKVPFDVTITNSSVSIEGETLVLSPVEFTVTATYGGKTVDVDTFSAYIDRVIEVTVEQAAKITTAVVVNADGSTRHVPTNVIEKDGKYYAVINSRTNSTYALIQNEVTFADAKGKWYEAAVNEMGSRKIIAGRSTSVFDGDASITRAEFIVILVRALGLPADGVSSFADVPADAWYTGAVATAAQYGIVSGKGDNQFDPNANITRQEAMLMLQRATALTEFTGAAGNLDSFTDADSVGSWARDAAKWSVGSGLIQGSGGKLNPTANITRAESATIILRLLQKASLVDVRSKD
ncbi:MAG: S-layer homology domain-containing protein, partial [Bacillota bacterium]